MNSPFPGMDPYLEDTLWSDVHTRLATKISNFLTPQIRPKYVARIERYVIEDDNPEGGNALVMYPDASVLLNEPVFSGNEPAALSNTPTPATQTLPVIPPIEVRIPVIEIRDRENNHLVTAIEVLSPVNKRKPGLQPYLEKRRKLFLSGIHFLEIDLLRQGTRPVQHPDLQSSNYLVALTRASSYRTDVWAVNLTSPLPTIPVPLLKPDADVTVDLQKALAEIYEEAGYDLSIDYDEESTPPLSDKDKIWAKGLVKN